MDVVGACRAFVSISERGSFTAGAATAGIPQSVASRRIAALEKHFGERLFSRPARRATLTSFGRDMLPSAKRLVRLAETLEHDARRAKLSPFRLAMPDTCATGDLARLIQRARECTLSLGIHPAGPNERNDLVHALDVRAAVAAVAPSDAVWSVPLGLASHARPTTEVVFIETLRVGRANRSPRKRIWIQPEDDVPAIRDRITHLGNTVGLAPTQVVVSPALAEATAEVLSSHDLLLCSQKQSDELGFHWCPIGEIHLVRGFDVVATAQNDADRIRSLFWDDIARCLGAGARSRNGSSR